MAWGRRGSTAWIVAVCALLAAAFAVAPTTAGADDDARCGKQRAAQARAAGVSEPGASLVVIGDSYSVGSGLSEGDAWPSRLKGAVHVDGFGGSGFSRHASPCGAVSFADRAPRALQHAADDALVVVQGGLNDSDQSDAAVEAGFTRLLEALVDRRVLVVGPPPAPDRADDVPRLDALLAGLTSRHGAAYLSMADQELPYLPDALHLTAEGHRLFGDTVATRVAELG